jgi:ADP-heptose:LPS heptosyltransferase
LLRQIHYRFPDKKIILTCAGNEREKNKMAALVAALDFQPWRVFAGDLDLLELAAVVQASCLHLGGDSGGLHLAWMTGAPTVTWFRRYEGLPDWQLQGHQHRAVVGNRSDQGIVGIDSAALWDSCSSILKQTGD